MPVFSVLLPGCSIASPKEWHTRDLRMEKDVQNRIPCPSLGRDGKGAEQEALCSISAKHLDVKPPRKALAGAKYGAVTKHPATLEGRWLADIVVAKQGRQNNW